MRVLWFTNIALPELSKELGQPPVVVGGWMSALLDELRPRADVEVAVATVIAGQRVISRHVVRGVTYYCLPATRTNPAGGLAEELRSACEAVVREFGPDLVHVHGTEDVYGLFTSTRSPVPPAVVSIQGLIHVYSRFVTGGLSLRDVSEGGIAGVLSWMRAALMRESWTRLGRREAAILAGNRYFIGRTDWDKAHVLANNPEGKYFECGELLRPAFHRRKWELRFARRASIFCTAAGSPHKGFHFVLDAVQLLRREFPNIHVSVAGSPWDRDRGYGYYGRFLKALVDRRGLSRHVTPLPALDAERVADELVSAHAFVIPSLIENSPNSLGEAMLVGTPCVAALVGGIPSMIDEGTTALGFQSGDAAYLAHCLRRIFTDDALAERLSSSARDAAARRFDVASNVATQLEIYRRITRDGRDGDSPAAGSQRADDAAGVANDAIRSRGAP